MVLQSPIVMSKIYRRGYDEESSETKAKGSKKTYEKAVLNMV